MTDVHTPAQRSRNMAAIRSKNTKPELRVKATLRQLGFTNYRLHRQDLPGKPDFVLPRERIAVLVHGCFWHSHRCKYNLTRSETNADFWARKLGGNVERDSRNRAALEEMGWKVLVIWECETKDPQALAQTMKTKLNQLTSSSPSRNAHSELD